MQDFNEKAHEMRNDLSAGSAAKPKPKSKHQALNDSINQIERIIRQAQHLHDRIVDGGQDELCAETTPTAPQSLAYVLGNGPSIIDKQNAEMSEILATIETELFGN